MMSIVAMGQARKPSLMVLPSNVWCNQNGCMTTFNNQGVTTEELPTFILEAVHQGNVVGTQGKGPRARTVYEFTYEGKPRRVAVQIGSNGFIVSANPKSMKGE